ncbi:NUDIX domain-containing protein [Salinirubellus salinus]|uniref:NUDIX domain-containing protein n=1 Tax=Salinirubellus salinus TaxID=1364945 RepID=A0A9E7R5J2_9EURY|nr:NUDIX domain-containing protein [Salinirubellus salinus]UWM55856.1 NUDIX domain-containing protein [Salinirubellus salinus]
MDPSFDVERLRANPSVLTRAEESVEDPEAFSYWDSLAGMVAVGVTNRDGAVLLMDGPHGWRLPYGPVEPTEEWPAVARRIARAVTGVGPEPSAVDRVSRHTHRHADTGRETVTHDVVVRAGPVEGTPIAATPTFGPWDDLTVD